MNFDFELYLVIGMAACGLIWFAYSLQRRLAQRRARGESGAGSGPREPLLVEYARSFFPVLLIVVVLRSFIFEPFRIPSGSMLPTLLIGDFILVSKYSYGLRLPVLHTKIFDIGEPERGDVAVFRYPIDPDVDYIKRIVGLPGDVIHYRDKRLVINGTPVTLDEIQPYVPSDAEDAQGKT